MEHFSRNICLASILENGLKLAVKLHQQVCSLGNFLWFHRFTSTGNSGFIAQYCRLGKIRSALKTIRLSQWNASAYRDKKFGIVVLTPSRKPSA
jgi:hypothetical protein